MTQNNEIYIEKYSFSLKSNMIDPKPYSTHWLVRILRLPIFPFLHTEICDPATTCCTFIPIVMMMMSYQNETPKVIYHL